jgi:hypothetical protein
MIGGMAKSAMDGMRALTLQIDPSIESLIEAHGFSFTGMNATDGDALALFRCQDGDGMPPWHLTIRHSAEEEMLVLLNKALGDQQQVSLSILIGTDAARTLAEGIGLAVSFVAISDQLKAAS